MTSSRVLYGLQLASLRASQWADLDADHRGAVRNFYSIPRTSQIGPTLAEAADMPLSLRAEKRALNHAA
ncbi:hypothetical protein MTO96_003058 [Rhipicephalus appendiculatus]